MTYTVEVNGELVLETNMAKKRCLASGAKLATAAMSA